MILTVIETGKPPEAIRPDWPAYPAMFQDLLRPALPDLEVETVALAEGQDLPDPATLDAVLITGSAAGVYDDLPWIPALLDFIRWAAAEATPQVGICFGHQALGQALGGQVIPSPKGWGIGRHRYDVQAPQPWMGRTPPSHFSLNVSHQDQVVVPPPGAVTVAASSFTPYAALTYAQGPAISFQGHPEFSDAFSAALYRARKGRPLTGVQVADAERSMTDGAADARLVANWIANFLKDAGAARS